MSRELHLQRAGAHELLRYWCFFDIELCCQSWNTSALVFHLVDIMFLILLNFLRDATGISYLGC